MHAARDAVRKSTMVELVESLTYDGCHRFEFPTDQPETENLCQSCLVNGRKNTRDGFYLSYARAKIWWAYSAGPIAKGYRNILFFIHAEYLTT